MGNQTNTMIVAELTAAVETHLTSRGYARFCEYWRKD